jgi:aldose 1-epimerase
MKHARRTTRALAASSSIFFVLACASGTGSTPAPNTQPRSVTRTAFGTTPDGQTVDAYTLRNPHGLRLTAITYGGIITAFRTPDRTHHFDDIVLGYDSLAGYLKSSPYFGAIVGRYGNRIAEGKFTLDGATYTLARNNGPNHLHGGLRGFDKVVWGAKPFHTDSTVGVVLTYTSKDGEEGYPGTLQARVTYTLTDADELAIDYEATTDKATPVNLTQHSYWNLEGEGKSDILGHQLMLNAPGFTPVDSTLIPTGVIKPVDGTPFDFRNLTAIGARIDVSDEQLHNGKGYDHNFVLSKNNIRGLVHAAHVLELTTGRTLNVYTTEPGLQFYSGNFLDGSITGKRGHVYKHRYGFALETQHFPDSPNKPNFPSTILRPGKTYHSRTVFEIGVEP